MWIQTQDFIRGRGESYQRTTVETSVLLDISFTASIVCYYLKSVKFFVTFYCTSNGVLNKTNLSSDSDIRYRYLL